MVWDKTIYFVPKEIIKGEIEIKLEVQLQCPDCRSFLEKLDENYRCPVGHADLNTTPEGYPILNEKGVSAKKLIYGEEFKGGLLWKKTLTHYKKAVYVASSEDNEDDLNVLGSYFASLKYEFRCIHLNDLNRMNIGREAMILFSHRIGRKDAINIFLKHFRHPLYRYVNGSVTRIQWPKLIVQVLRNSLYRRVIGPFVSSMVEARYDRYLSDKRMAEHFARTYLPPEMQNGKGRQVFDIGCGRGRHVAMLSQLGFTVTGMDLKPHPYWGRLSKSTFIVGSAECLQYIPNAAFDFVICMEVLMYLADDDTLLAHIRRMLKRGGYFLLQVTNKDNLHTVLTKEPLAQDPYLQRYYNQSELCHKLKQNGFKVDRVWTEKFYIPFFILPGNLFYEFILSPSLQATWDKLVPSRYLGLINILAKPV